MADQTEDARAIEILRRLLRHTSVPDRATTKTYSSGEIRTINVPARVLVQAIRLVNAEGAQRG